MAEEKRKVVAVRAKVAPKEESALFTVEKEPEKQPEKQPEKKPFYKQLWFWLICLGVLLAFIALVGRNNGGSGGTQNAEPETTAPGVVASVTEATEPAYAETTTEVGGNVSINLPADLFEGQTKEEIEAAGREEGMLSTTVQPDGSVTYTMTPEKQQELKGQYKTLVDETIRAYTMGAEDGPRSYRNITYNGRMNRFDIKVDPNVYKSSQTDSLYMAAFYLLGAYYQAFDGIPRDQIDVAVNLYDQDSYTVLDSGTYKQFAAQQ